MRRITKTRTTRGAVSSRQSLALVVLVVLAALGLFGYQAFRRANSVPSFASLAEAPDPSLKGTVAWLDWSTDVCLHVVPSGGGADRRVVCLAEVNGGAIADGIAWRADGRVEITMYGRWQKIVDVHTATVEDVPAAQVPAAAQDTASGTRSSDGRVLAVENDDGRVRLTMQDAAGLHVLLDANGGSQYSLGTPRWSPDEAFVLTTDSAARLLVTTLGTAPQTRVLATHLGGGFAVTASQE